MRQQEFILGLIIGTLIFIPCGFLAACGRIPTSTSPAPTPNISRTETAIAKSIFATVTASAKDTVLVQPSITVTSIPVPLPTLTEITKLTPIVRPPTFPRATPMPTSPSATKVTFPIFPDGSLSPTGQSAYPCYQDSGFYEVVVYIKQIGNTGQRSFVEFLQFTAFAPGGSVLKEPSGSPLVATTDDGKKGTFYGLPYNLNCMKETPANDTFNGKLDVSDLVRAGNKQIAIRFVRSDGDLTPISPEVIVDFSKAGRWWLYFGAQ